MAEELQPIIIKRINAKHPHHGGSWKVAFADFATAMMAFFLMMWLMGATTADQRGGISQYFKNPSIVQGASPLPSPSAMQGPGGPSNAMIKNGGAMEMYREPPKNIQGKIDYNDAPLNHNTSNKQGDVDHARLQSLMVNLKDAIDDRPTLKPFANQVLMDLTAEGLRVQVIDKEAHSMFAVGSAQLEPTSANMLHELAAIITTVPNRISITGHTDGLPYARPTRPNYGNWELSADRANAARRALIEGGLPAEKIGRVVGLSSFAPLDPSNPENPINRRISIIVLNKRTEDAIRQESGALFSMQTNQEAGGQTSKDAKGSAAETEGANQPEGVPHDAPAPVSAPAIPNK